MEQKAVACLLVCFTLCGHDMTFIAPEGRLMSTSEGYLMSTHEGYLMSAPEGHLMPKPEGHLMSTPVGYLMPTPERYLMSTPERYLVSTPEGYLMPTPEKYLVSTPEGYLTPTSDGYLMPTLEGYIMPTHEGYLMPTLEEYLMPTPEGYLMPTQEENLMPRVMESTTSHRVRMFETSRVQHSHHPTTPLDPQREPDMAIEKTYELKRQLFMYNKLVQAVNDKNEAAQPISDLGNETLQVESTHSTEDFCSGQQNEFGDVNNTQHRNKNCLDSQWNTLGCQGESIDLTSEDSTLSPWQVINLPAAQIDSGTQLASPRENETESNSINNTSSLSNGTGPVSLNDYEKLFYVQLGTEWIPKCFNGKFCYEKCQQVSPYDNGSVLLEIDSIEEGDSLCSSDSLYGNFCSCDPKCVVYGDCCPDVFLHCRNASDVNTIISLINETGNRLLFQEDTGSLVDRLSVFPGQAESFLDFVYVQFGSCQKVNSNGEDKSTMLVSRCPSNVEDSLRAKCETSVSPLLPPVSAPVASVIVDFLNVYCALCHGVDVRELTAWPTRISCDSKVTNYINTGVSPPDILAFIKTGLCRVTYIDRPRPCGPRLCQRYQALTHRDREQLVSSVNRGECSHTDALLCISYLHPFEGFRNPHCKKCHSSISWTKREVNTQPGNRVHNTKCSIIEQKPNSFSGGILLFLDITGTYTTLGISTQYFCHDNEVFDVLTHECKLLMCPRGHQAYRGQCLGVVGRDLGQESVNNSPHRWTSLRLVVHAATRDVSCDNFSAEYIHATAPDLIVDNIRVIHFVTEPQIVTNNETPHPMISNNPCFDEYRNATSDKFNESSVQVEIALSRDINFATLEQVQRLALYITRDQCEANITSVHEGEEYVNLCDHPKRYTPVTKTETNGSVYVLISTSVGDVYRHLQSVGYEMRISRQHESLQITESIHVCEEGSLLSSNECAMVMYRVNETTFNSSMLTVIKSGQIYTAGDFEISDDVVYVCSNFQFPAQREISPDNTVYLILNLVFSGISVLLLLIMAIIYCIFPSLCTLPGKMTASLGASMGLVFIANMLTFVESHNEHACRAVAFISHVALLAQFGWMSAIAVNMAATFGPLALSNVFHWNTNGHFRQYNALIYGISLAIAIPAVILDAVQDNQQTMESPCVNETLNTTDNLTEVPSLACQSSSLSSSSFDYPRYGYPLCRWVFSPLWIRMVFIMVPFFISYLINITCFIATLVGLHQASRLTKKLGKKSAKRVQCLIYLKLSTAMGFTWIFSLVGNVFRSTPIVVYLFTILILLQGVFLFLAFMANKRVLTLIRRRLISARGQQQTLSGATGESDLYTTSR